MAKNVVSILKGQIRNILLALSSPSIIFFALIGNGILLLISFLMFLTERDINPDLDTFSEAIYWGITTMTTVGYGDVVPISTTGKILAVILMISGTALFVGFAGILVTFLIKEEVESELIPLEAEVEAEENLQILISKKLDEVLVRLDKLEKK